MNHQTGSPRSFDLVAVPYDGAATLGWPGSRYAPGKIREALGWITMRAENGHVYSVETEELRPAPDLRIDLPDVDVVPHDLMATLDAASATVSDTVRHGRVPILLGGDDCLLYAGVKGLHDAVEGSVAVVHFDAHLDLMDHNPRQGSFSQSSGMRRSLELERVDHRHTIQLGLRHFNFPSSLEFIRREGPAQIPALEFSRIGVEAAMERILDRVRSAEHLFFSFDIDTIDPAYAPGAGAHEPGGLTSREGIELVKALAPYADGFAVTEVNPMTDLGDRTSNLAAYLCYYFAMFGGERRRA
ncbi:arginase family protein [Leucobacter sp. wl10]|uniref:arginase family protein n=1 Tax=Leucobacter sp. wl10 TaxID=2304677 RepID=UPI000E5B8948|nr:arginase family protein [Leucobacter sp. wl10]RGE21126.1 arginase family protein [Leucobacter sp. wl10]